MNNRSFNLQLFSQEKTEKATPKKRKESRDKGQVLHSKEINTALLVLGSILGLRLFLPYMVNQVTSFSIKSFDSYLINDGIFTIKGITSVLNEVFFTSFKIVAPIMGIALLMGLIASYSQVGFLFTTQTLKMNLNKINPIEGFKRIFSKKALVELLKSTLKISILLYIGYSFIEGKLDEVPQLSNLTPYEGMGQILNWVFGVSLRIGIALVVLSSFDYFYQWWDYENSLKMSKQDVKEEFKQVEGNPQIKSKIKEKQRQMSLRRMMQELPNADVIITNPTHFAVAIKYDSGISEAPMVIAKGLDLMALKIREEANKNKIPIVENKPLAQSLYKTVDIGSSIPPELYQAVAEVLAYVYSLNSN